MATWVLLCVYTVGLPFVVPQLRCIRVCILLSSSYTRITYVYISAYTRLSTSACTVPYSEIQIHFSSLLLVNQKKYL